MIWVLFTLILPALAVLADDTNGIRVDALPAGGKIYTNAVIILANPAYAVVNYQGGIVQIPMSNMPAAYQVQSGYTPEKSAQFLNEQKQIQEKQRQALLAWQAATQARPGTNRPVRITAIIDETSNGGIPLCSADGISGGILVRNFPDAVRKFLADYRQLQADITDCEEQINRLKAAGPPPAQTAPQMQTGGLVLNKAVTKDNFTQNYYILRPQKAADPVVTWRNTLRNAEDRLEALTAELDQKTADYNRCTTITAYPAGENFGPKPIWVCTAPPAAAAR